MFLLCTLIAIDGGDDMIMKFFFSSYFVMPSHLPVKTKNCDEGESTEKRKFLIY